MKFLLQKRVCPYHLNIYYFFKCEYNLINGESTSKRPNPTGKLETSRMILWREIEKRIRVSLIWEIRKIAVPYTKYFVTTCSRHKSLF